MHVDLHISACSSANWRMLGLYARACCVNVLTYNIYFICIENIHVLVLLLLHPRVHSHAHCYVYIMYIVCKNFCKWKTIINTEQKTISKYFKTN